MSQNLIRYAAAGDQGGYLAAQAFSHVIDDRFMSLHPQLPGNRKTCGAAADNSNFMARRRGRFRGLGLEAGFPEDGGVNRRQTEGMAGTVIHA